MLVDAIEDNLYNHLSAAVQVVTPLDQLIVLGDMNAESGTDDHCGNGIVGPFDFGAANDNNDIYCLSAEVTISPFCDHGFVG